MQWVYLAIAIVTETIATSAMKAAEGFTRAIPSLVVVMGYGISFYFFSQTLKTLPVGMAYAIWSGVGLVLVTLAGWILYGQKLDAPALIGIALIGAGVVVMNVFSSTTQA
ncbi:DMT family transporter [Pararhodospirillum oryzae]|uniref:Multidrug transporter n=1 Tax=Pararhodospirillum oryzae TaxID=478448 RepID=A0A512HBH4_9PROT|nr:multidrug transporter [Pararhodospirillum oryzae]